MYIISQELKEMLNKRINNSISETIFSTVEILTDKIFNKYC